jgi:hypothetical protein
MYLQVLPTVILALATSAPLLLTKEPSSPGAAGPAARRRVRIPPWMGLLFALSILIAVALARFAVFDVVQVGDAEFTSELTE